MKPQPLFAAFLGGWEIIFILAAFVVMLLVIAMIGAIIYFLSRRHQVPPPNPTAVPTPPAPAETAQAPQSNCPHCGKPVPPTSLGGICPECMLKAGLATQTEGPGNTGPHGTKIVPPLLKPEEIAPLFPQLEILECLGRGGMGVVYKARQPRLNRLVALKILAREKEQDAKFAERFAREAQALARLNHPNIVTVYDFGTVGQASGLSPSEKQNEQSETGKMPVLHYLLMEFVDGLNLRQLLQTGKMPPEQALTIVPKICDALQYAHEQGIVHRDIKPENILLDKQGRVKIADFGIAKMLGGGDALPRVQADRQIGPTRLTEEGHTIGTPHYMAPEQIEKPLTVDHRADIYSLGVVFYEMLTGELPLGKFQPPSKKVQIDVRLDEVVLHALEKEPERRYQQASVLKTEVETIASTPESGRSRREEAQTEGERQKRGSDKSSESPVISTVTNQAPRFSRTAIVGACLSLPFVLPALALTVTALFSRETQSNILANLVWSMAPLLLLFGLPGICVTTILGWVAVSQIRRSAGKIYGMWLAVFDGLLFPLLAFDTAVYLFVALILMFVHLRLGLSAMVVLCLIPLISLPTAGILDFLIIRRIWRAVSELSGAPAPPIQRPGHFWRWFAVTAVALTATFIFIALIGLLAAVAIPNFVKARAQAQENARHAAELLALQNSGSTTNFYIGQTWFPQGDSIEITSVERTENQMTVKGRYNLVSHDSALLALYITSTNTNVHEASTQTKEISSGSGEFELIHSHLVPGWPHVSMYADGHPFASLYFGTEAEALEESKAAWITNSTVNATGDASQLAQKGWQLWQSGKLAEAEGKFQQAVRLAPNDANAWNGLGWAQFNSGNLQEAEQAFQKAVSLDPNQPGALNGLGQIDLSQRKYDQAETYLLKAAPQAPAAWHGLTRLYLLEGKYAQAEKWSQDLIDAGQADDLVHQMLKAAQEKHLSEGLKFRIEPPSMTNQSGWITNTLSASPETGTPSFGPVFERVLVDSKIPFKSDFERTNAMMMIDFDSGKLFNGPQSMWDADTDAQRRWMQTNGVDALCVVPEVGGLVGLDMRAVPVSPQAWDAISAAMLDQLTRHPRRETVLINAKDSMPPTWLFQTRERGVGILQITGFTENPRGVKIRYKLVVVR